VSLAAKKNHSNGDEEKRDRNGIALIKIESPFLCCLAVCVCACNERGECLVILNDCIMALAGSHSSSGVYDDDEGMEY
jgi:hypothetical protein